MELFACECETYELKNDEFFLSWHQAIKDDLRRFLIILEKYEDSENKQRLIGFINYIRDNISNNNEIDASMLLLRSTPRYFLYSFVGSGEEIPTYVLVSKDYKKILITSEEMECFDYPEFDQDERYGLYNYSFFKLTDNEIKYIETTDIDYTIHYNCYLWNGFYDKSDYEKTDLGYDFICEKYERKLTNGKI